MIPIKGLQEEISSVISLFSQGNIQEALNSSEVLIKTYPTEATLFNIRGACFAELKFFDDAIVNYKKALNINPDYAKAHFNLAGTFQDLEKFDDAVKSYKCALQIEPNYAEAHNNLGNALKDLNQIEDAIKCYKRAVEIIPDYIEAYYSLGIAYQALGKLDNAVENFKVVLTLRPNFAEMHNNLGVVLQQLAQYECAVNHFEKALKIKPDFTEALKNLGNVFTDLNQNDAAVEVYQKAISINPNYHEAYYCLGISLHKLEKLEDAAKSYKHAIFIKPDYPEALNNLGIVLLDLDHFDEALKSYKDALLLKPDFVDAHFNHGNLCRLLGKMDLAKNSYLNALDINPEYVEAINNLGNLYNEIGQLHDSVDYFNKAILIKYDYADVHNNLGNVLVELGELDDACKSYKRAIDIDSNYAEAHNNLGIVNYKLGKLDEAAAMYNKALVLNSSYADSYANLAIVMKDLKQFDNAISNYEKAIALNSKLDYIQGDLLHTRMHICSWDNWHKDIKELTININSDKKTANPFSILALIDDPNIQKKTSEIYINHLHPQSKLHQKIKLYPRHKKIRLGYFSADFRDHPVSDLTAELYEVHDRDKFEIYAFSFGEDTNDKMNLRVKLGVDHFYDVHKMPYDEVVKLSRLFEIDIAIDLGGFTSDSRTAVFAMSVAPIQISYIGYLGTMGANYYDYLVADSTIIPKKNQKYYSEKIAYLPCFQVNDSKQVVPSTFFTRQDIGLPQKGFVFCCFNNTFKITPSTFDSWARILVKVEDSVLLIYADNKLAEINLTKEIVTRGVNSKRLIFGARLPKSDYLARYRVADLFLDTHPYNAGTTASDALRMGLPILTYTGNSFPSRMASSLLNAINLPDLIATSQEHYENIAIELALNSDKFKIIKDKLTDNLLTSELYNTPLFTKNIESAYMQMYERYQNELEPDHIYANPSTN